jgi:hypothetical protein
MENFRIISIESLKGGVGKTTLGLGLAKLLLDSGNQVMVFDFDFAGTELQLACKVLEKHNYWHDKFHYVVEKRDNVKGFRPVNLVEMFSQYMKSPQPFKILWSSSKKTATPSESGKLVLSKDKINVFSSILGRMSKQNAKNNCLPYYGPETLFDINHSRWLLDMVKQLMQSCLNDHNAEKKIVFIIDNSPGFARIEPELDEWMTNLGPIVARHIFIATVDHQDIKETLDTIKSLNQRFKEKWEISRKVLKLAEDSKKEGDTPENIDIPKHKRFFKHLVFAHKNQKTSNRKSDILDNLSFFLDSKNSEADEFPIETSRYISVVLNRIPSHIFPDLNFYLNCTGTELQPVVAQMKKNLIHSNQDLSISYVEKSVLNKDHELLKNIMQHVENLKSQNSLDLGNADLSQTSKNRARFLDHIKAICGYEKTCKLVVSRLGELESCTTIGQLLKKHASLLDSEDSFLPLFGRLFHNIGVLENLKKVQDSKDHNLLAHQADRIFTLTAGDKTFQAVPRVIAEEEFPSMSDEIFRNQCLHQTGYYMSLLLAFSDIDFFDKKTSSMIRSIFYSFELMTLSVLLKKQRPGKSKLSYSRVFRLWIDKDELIAISSEIIKNIRSQVKIPGISDEDFVGLFVAFFHNQLRLRYIRQEFEILSKLVADIRSPKFDKNVADSIYRILSYALIQKRGNYSTWVSELESLVSSGRVTSNDVTALSMEQMNSVLSIIVEHLWNDN